MISKRTERAQQIIGEGVLYASKTNKFIVRVKVKTPKGMRLTTLISFKKEQDAIDYYNNWLKENKKE